MLRPGMIMPRGVSRPQKKMPKVVLRPGEIMPVEGGGGLLLGQVSPTMM